MSQKRTFSRNLVRNKKGFSILEVLIAAGLLSIISLGIITMLENMTLDQKRVQVLTTLRDLKSKIEFAIKDQNSWVNTVQDGALNDPANPGAGGWACLRNTAACTVAFAAPGNPPKLILKDAANNTLYNLLSWTDTTGNGFTETGLPCTGFDSGAGTGNDSCPISYRLVYIFKCAGAAASCVDPQIRVTARMVYNPSPSTMLNRFRALIAQGNMTAGGTTGADDDSDDARYDVSVVRSAAMINRSFKLTMTFTGPAVGPFDCTNAGVGTCNMGAALNQAGARHPLQFSVEDDTADLVTLQDTNFAFSFNEKGYYNCTAAVTAFATMGFEAGIVQRAAGAAFPGTLVASGSTVAGKWAQSVAIVETRFSVTDTTLWYSIAQKCDDNAPGGTPVADNCTLGMNIAPYPTNIANIVTFSCYRLDKTF